MKSIKVTRFGKLLPVSQAGNFGKDGFHNAPENEGFYCFNTKFIEHFLSSHCMYKNDVYHGEIVDGTIWVHLEPPQKNMILSRYNSWYLIRAKDYNKILTSLYNSQVTSFDKYFGSQKYAKDHLEIFCTKDTVFKNIHKGFNKYKTRGKERSDEIFEELWEKESDRYSYYANFNKEKTYEND